MRTFIHKYTGSICFLEKKIADKFIYVDGLGRRFCKSKADFYELFEKYDSEKAKQPRPIEAPKDDLGLEKNQFEWP